MAPQKTLERLVEGEEGEERARVAEHHDEPRHGADAVADRDRPKRPPINLGLFRRQRHHAAIHARRDVRPQVAHAAADLPGGPGIAALPEHLMEPGRAEAWILGQRVANERQKRVERARPRFAAPGRTSVELNGAADGLVVDAERRGDRLDLPVLAEIQPPNLGALGRTDHAQASWRRGATAPGPATGCAGHRRDTASGPGPPSTSDRERPVCGAPRDEGKPDPSRGHDTRAGGRDDRDDLRDSVDGGGGRRRPRRAAPSLGTEPSSTHARDHSSGRWRRAGHSGDRFSGGGVDPRRRSPCGDLRLDDEPEP